MWQLILAALAFLIPFYLDNFLALFSPSSAHTSPSRNPSINDLRFARRHGMKNLEGHLVGMLGSGERGGDEMWAWAKDLNIDFHIYDWNRTLYHILEGAVSEGRDKDSLDEEQTHAATSTLLVVIGMGMVLLNSLSPSLGYLASCLFSIFYRFEACSLWISPSTRYNFSPEEGLRVFLLMYLVELGDRYLLDVGDRSTAIWRALILVIMTSEGVFNHGGGMSYDGLRSTPPVMRKFRGLYHTGDINDFSPSGVSGLGGIDDEKSILEKITDGVLLAVPVVGINQHNAKQTMKEMGRFQKLILAGIMLSSIHWLYSSGIGTKELCSGIINLISILESLRCVKTDPKQSKRSKQETEIRQADCRNLLCLRTLVETMTILENLPGVYPWLKVFIPTYLYWKTVMMFGLIYGPAPKGRGGSKENRHDKLAEWVFISIHDTFGKMEEAARSGRNQSRVGHVRRSRFPSAHSRSSDFSQFKEEGIAGRRVASNGLPPVWKRNGG